MQPKKVTTELEKFTSDALGYLKWESLLTTCEVVDMSKPLGFLQSAT